MDRINHQGRIGLEDANQTITGNNALSRNRHGRMEVELGERRLGAGAGMLAASILIPMTMSTAMDHGRSLVDRIPAELDDVVRQVAQRVEADGRPFEPIVERSHDEVGCN